MYPPEQYGAMTTIATEVAREELTQFVLILQARLEKMGPTRSNERNMTVEVLKELLKTPEELPDELEPLPPDYGETAK